MKEEKSKPEYKYAFNKVFTGSYLIYNLGNELINFIKTDNNGSEFGDKRLVYLNPYGNRCKKAAAETKYVLHIMKTVYDNEKCYELVAISKILEKSKDGKIVNAETLYNINNPEKEKANYKNKNIKFEKFPIGDIFNDTKAHLCSFFAEELLEPKENTRILFKVDASENDIKDKKLENTYTKNGTKNILTINIKSNLPGSRNLCYSRKNDLDILDELVKSTDYLKKINDSIKIEDIKDEPCFAVLCDRTNLEDSMSNQIAYFLSKKKEVLKGFIDLLNSKKNKDTKDIEEGNFKVIREHNKIDILLESDNDIIVIENKIDSSIIVYNKDDKKTKTKKPSGKVISQLSKYYEYIIKDYKDECKNKNTKKEKHFYILKPEYNSINDDELSKYKYGEKYQIITYTELYETLKLYNVEKPNTESEFLYDQFIQSLEYVKSSKAEQMRKTAYIRLKQKINELKNKNSNN